MTIAMTAKDQSVDYIPAGGAFTDPVFGAIKAAFYGLNKGSTDKITVDNSGTTAATVKFTDYRGNEKTVTYAYTASTAFSPTLNWTSTKQFHVLENETVRKFDYVLLTPAQGSEFSHLMQYSAASNLGSSNAYIELTDVFSGDTTRIYLLPGGYTNATFYLDGQAYYAAVVGTTAQTAAFTWGTSAAVNTIGATTMVYPLIKAKGGEWVTFATSVNLTNGQTFEFPSGNSTNASYWYNQSADYDKKLMMGRLHFNISSGDLRVADTSRNYIDYPAILVVEEKGYDTSNNLVQDGIVVYMADGSGSGVDLTVKTGASYMTAATSYNAAETTDNSVTWFYDRYGTMVKYDTDGQGLVEITYPDNQADAVVAVGSNPSFTTAGGGVTVDTAVKITEPVAKLDSEISTSAVTFDLVLVGGPCVNTLVAELLADTVTCDTWAYSEGIIKEVSGIFGTSHKALVVAGTTKADTRALAAKVMKGTLSYEA
jgi:hypothetical protein